VSTSITIAPFKTGLDSDEEPWLLPPDAFTEINNIHIHHGYLEKRQGYIPFGTLPSADRVMGIYQYIDATGGRTTLAFDTTRAYRFNSATNAFVALDPGAIMSGSSNDYVWAANWQSSGGTNRLYFTNGVVGTGGPPPTLNGIRFYDTSISTAITTPLTATLGTAGGVRTLWGCKLIFAIGQRLVCLYTYEGTASGSDFPQRARWCAKQNPNNWNDTVAGGGGFTDAATGDQIISARLIQNQVIVFFTNSVWSLVPTSDPNRAFRWQKINDYRATGGKMSTVSYDRYIASLGDRGITATDGVETRRVDDRIEEFTINRINVDQFSKVFCLRSYAKKRWWTLFPSQSATENDSALIYDDESHAFSTYSISLNCLGYGNKGLDYTIDDFSVANNLDLSLDQMGEDTLQSYYWQENSNVLLGGNTTGNVFILESSASDNGAAINSSFYSAAWNPFIQENRECKMPYVDLFIDTDPETTAAIEFFKDTDETCYATQDIDFLPPLHFIALINGVDNTNPCNVNSPNHGLSTGEVIFIYGVLGTEVNSGESEEGYTITRVNDNNFTLDGVDATALSAYSDAGAIYRNRFYRTKTWKRAYAGGTGFQHRIRFTSSGSNRPYRIHSLRPTFKATGKRTIN
jgi:hypothetical protein